LRIFVTGANGFIGSHLVRRLVNEGHNVGITLRTGSDIWRIRDIILRFTVFNADLADTDAVSNAISSFKPEIVFHLAAYYVVEHKPSDISSLYNSNVLGLANLLDASANANVRLFVNTSTFFVYDRNAFGKQTMGIINPVNLYANTKLHGEQACNYYADHGMKCVTFRLFPPYGEMDTKRKFIPFIILSALKGELTELKTSLGFQKWDFTYVGDIVDAYMSLIPVYMPYNPDSSKSHEIFDIGTGHAPTLQTVVNVILNMLNSKINPVWGALPYRNNEVFYACANTDVAKSKLGWTAKNTLFEGLKKTVDWYRNSNQENKKV